MFSGELTELLSIFCGKSMTKFVWGKTVGGHRKKKVWLSIFTLLLVFMYHERSPFQLSHLQIKKFLSFKSIYLILELYNNL